MHFQNKAFFKNIDEVFYITRPRNYKPLLAELSSIIYLCEGIKRQWNFLGHYKAENYALLKFLSRQIL